MPDTMTADQFNLMRNDAQSKMVGIMAGARMSELRAVTKRIPETIFPTQLNYGQLLELERNWLFSKICKRPIQLQTSERSWYDLEAKKGKLSPTAEERYWEECDRLNLRRHLAKAMYFQKFFGGGAVIVFADDGRPMDQPLQLRNVRRIERLRTVHRHELSPYFGAGTNVYVDYDDPELFQLVQVRHPEIESGLLMPGLVIHKSRVLRFVDWDLSYDTHTRYNSWGPSLVEMIFDEICQFFGVKDAAENLLKGKDILIHAINNLSEMVKDTEQWGNIQQYVQDTHRILEEYNIAVMDGAVESAEYKSRPLAGLADSIDKFQSFVCACGDIPYIEVWGEVGKASLGDSGNSEQSNWYEKLEADRSERLDEHIRRVSQMIFAQSDGPSVAKSFKLGIQWRPIETPDPKDKAELRLKVLEGDRILNTMVDPVTGMPGLFVQEIRDRHNDGDFQLEMALQVPPNAEEYKQLKLEERENAKAKMVGASTVGKVKTKKDEAEDKGIEILDPMIMSEGELDELAYLPPEKAAEIAEDLPEELK